ncbi:MAG: MerR family transcriptional regulator [Gemmataceae bacterium]
MKKDFDRWTIDDLHERVRQALAIDYDGAGNGRVRDVPDVRSIRYYTTLGLLDRAAEMKGRTALYSRRHLLQLVAIKRLQAQGLSLGVIQERLLGLSDAKLAQMARLPDNFDLPPPMLEAVAVPPRDERFWTAAPVAADENENLPPASPVALQGVPLDETTTLLLAADRPLERDDIEAIRAAAAPLLHLLHTRRLSARQKGDPV